MGSVMIKTTMVDVILMVVTAAVKMLTKTFAPYVNASKKKLHCQMVIFDTNHMYLSYYLSIYHIHC